MLSQYPTETKNLQTTLKKANSHLMTVMKMVDNDEYCIDIIQQLKAVHGLIHSAMDKTLQLHLSSCFKKGMETASNEKKEQLIAEIVQVTKITNK